MSPLLHMFSAYNRLCFEVSRKVHWKRTGYREVPAENLSNLTSTQQTRISGLRWRYKVAFEKKYGKTAARENYGYLDMLDRSAEEFNWNCKPGGKIVDVGSKNFFYASALHQFFKPDSLQGIEVDGHCIYQDLYSRFDYAQAYIDGLENTYYDVMDICNYNESANGVTCFYPFVKPETLVYWRLPLNLFKPENIFRRICSILDEDGFFLMVNHGYEEGQIALKMMRKQNLRFIGQFEYENPVFERTNIPVISLWRKIRSRSGEIGTRPRNDYFARERRKRTVA